MPRDSFCHSNTGGSSEEIPIDPSTDVCARRRRFDFHPIRIWYLSLNSWHLVIVCKQAAYRRSWMSITSGRRKIAPWHDGAPIPSTKWTVAVGLAFRRCFLEGSLRCRSLILALLTAPSIIVRCNARLSGKCADVSRRSCSGARPAIFWTSTCVEVEMRHERCQSSLGSIQPSAPS
jgi:hypothetical protein